MTICFVLYNLNYIVQIHLISSNFTTITYIFLLNYIDFKSLWKFSKHGCWLSVSDAKGNSQITYCNSNLFWVKEINLLNHELAVIQNVHHLRFKLWYYLKNYTLPTVQRIYINVSETRWHLLKADNKKMVHGLSKGNV